MSSGKVAIVTGASSGIGLSIAKMWTARGGRVALVARTKSKLDDIVKELGEERAVAFPLDVQDLKSLCALPARVKEHFGRLDCVVNNAGLNHRGPIDRFDAMLLADIIQTNLTAPIVLTRACLDHLESDGSIVQVASIAGMVPVPGEATYSASKAGLRAFTRAVLECIDQRLEEIALPARTGRLATMAYLMPSFAKKIRPALEKRGAKNKKALIAARRRSVS